MFFFSWLMSDLNSLSRRQTARLRIFAFGSSPSPIPSSPSSPWKRFSVTSNLHSLSFYSSFSSLAIVVETLAISDGRHLLSSLSCSSLESSATWPMGIPADMSCTMPRISLSPVPMTWSVFRSSTRLTFLASSCVIRRFTDTTWS